MISLAGGGAGAARGTESGAEGDRTGFVVDECSWGYRIRRGDAAPVWLLALQAAAWATGICASVAAFSLWFVQVSLPETELFMLRCSACAILIAIAGLMFDFARQGTETEIEIDLARGELRETVRNRAGRPTVLGRHGFDAVGGVFIDRSGARDPGGRARLLLRIGNTAQTLPVVAGEGSALEPLRDRLGRDLVLRARGLAGR
jgi:hypothetical protein